MFRDAHSRTSYSKDTSIEKRIEDAIKNTEAEFSWTQNIDHRDHRVAFVYAPSLVKNANDYLKTNKLAEAAFALALFIPTYQKEYYLSENYSHYHWRLKDWGWGSEWARDGFAFNLTMPTEEEVLLFCAEHAAKLPVKKLAELAEKLHNLLKVKGIFSQGRYALGMVLSELLTKEPSWSHLKNALDCVEKMESKPNEKDEKQPKTASTEDVDLSDHKQKKRSFLLALTKTYPLLSRGVLNYSQLAYIDKDSINTLAKLISREPEQAEFHAFWIEILSRRESEEAVNIAREQLEKLLSPSYTPSVSASTVTSTERKREHKDVKNAPLPITETQQISQALCNDAAYRFEQNKTLSFRLFIHLPHAINNTDNKAEIKPHDKIGGHMFGLIQKQIGDKLFSEFKKAIQENDAILSANLLTDLAEKLMNARENPIARTFSAYCFYLSAHRFQTVEHKDSKISAIKNYYRAYYQLHQNRVRDKNTVLETFIALHKTVLPSCFAEYFKALQDIFHYEASSSAENMNALIQTFVDISGSMQEKSDAWKNLFEFLIQSIEKQTVDATRVLYANHVKNLLNRLELNFGKSSIPQNLRPHFYLCRAKANLYANACLSAVSDFEKLAEDKTFLDASIRGLMEAGDYFAKLKDEKAKADSEQHRLDCYTTAMELKKDDACVQIGFAAAVLCSRKTELLERKAAVEKYFYPALTTLMKNITAVQSAEEVKEVKDVKDKKANEHKKEVKETKISDTTPSKPVETKTLADTLDRALNFAEDMVLRLTGDTQTEFKKSITNLFLPKLKNQKLRELFCKKASEWLKTPTTAPVDVMQMIVNMQDWEINDYNLLEQMANYIAENHRDSSVYAPIAEKFYWRLINETKKWVSEKVVLLNKLQTKSTALSQAFSHLQTIEKNLQKPEGIIDILQNPPDEKQDGKYFEMALREWIEKFATDKQISAAPKVFHDLLESINEAGNIRIKYSMLFGSLLKSILLPRETALSVAICAVIFSRKKNYLMPYKDKEEEYFVKSLCRSLSLEAVSWSEKNTIHWVRCGIPKNSFYEDSDFLLSKIPDDTTNSDTLFTSLIQRTACITANNNKDVGALLVNALEDNLWALMYLLDRYQDNLTQQGKLQLIFIAIKILLIDEDAAKNQHQFLQKNRFYELQGRAEKLLRDHKSQHKLSSDKQPVLTDEAKLARWGYDVIATRRDIISELKNNPKPNEFIASALESNTHLKNEAVKQWVCQDGFGLFKPLSQESIVNALNKNAEQRKAAAEQRKAAAEQKERERAARQSQSGAAGLSMFYFADRGAKTDSVESQIQHAVIASI